MKRLIVVLMSLWIIQRSLMVIVSKCSWYTWRWRYHFCLPDGNNYNICWKVGSSDPQTFFSKHHQSAAWTHYLFCFKTPLRRKKIPILNKSVCLLLKLPIQYQQKRLYTLTMLRTNKKNQNKKTGALRLFH